MDIQPNAIYDPEKIHDDLNYQGFACADWASLPGNATMYDDFWPTSRDWDWEAPRLAGIWRPIELIGDPGPSNDYPRLGLLVPVFSERAVEALRDFLEPNGQILGV